MAVIFSREGVAQGDSLVMVAYSISFLLLIYQLKQKFPDVFQPWYADDGAGMTCIPRLLKFFDRLCVLGPPFGYYPEQSKSILIVQLDSQPHAAKIIAKHKFKTTWSRYFGVFIGEPLTQTVWITEKVTKWSEGASQLAKLAINYP